MPKAIYLTDWKYTINVLATLRTADGFGFDDFVLMGEKKIDLEWIKKVAKRTLVDFVGGLHLSYFPDIDSVMKYIHEKNYTPVVIECNKGIDIDQFIWPSNPIIIVGHEVYGVPMDHFRGIQQVYINMERNATSLNLACAASIAMYSLHLHEIKREKEQKSEKNK